MVELSAFRLSTIFHALGDTTRRRMLRELADGGRTVGQLAQPLAIWWAVATKHIEDAAGSPTPRKGDNP